MKVILEIEQMPENCQECPLSDGYTGERGETLWCVPLSHKEEAIVDGDFLKRREDCPLKQIKEGAEDAC